MNVRLQIIPQKLQSLQKNLVSFLHCRELIYVIVILIFGIVFMAIPNLTTIYPIGHDTQAYLGNLKLMYEINFKSNQVYVYPLLPFFFSLLYSIGVNMIAFLKAYTIVMYGLVGISIYYFARKNLAWNYKKSLVVGLIFLSSPITLRIGWELHSQTIAMAIFFIALVQLNLLSKMGSMTIKSKLRSKQFFLILILTILIGWLHLLVAIFFFFVLISSLIIDLFKTKKIDFLFLFLAFILVASTFVFSVVLVPNPLGPSNFTNLNAAISFTGTGPSNLSWAYSLFLLSYMFLIPFSIVGLFSESQVVLMTIFPTLFILSFFIFSISFIPLERAIYLYQYPLSIFAVSGLSRLGNFGKTKNIFDRFETVFSKQNVTISLVLLLTIFQSMNMSGLFQPISLYSNTPSGYPANLQWAGVFIPEIDKVITMTKWCNDHLNSSSLIIVPDGAYGWVKYYLNENLHVVKWGIYYHPFGSTVLLQNKSLIYIPEEMPNLLLAEPILQTFHPIYVLYTPSWDIQNAYDNIYPVAEKVISQGDAVLYRLKQ